MEVKSKELHGSAVSNSLLIAFVTLVFKRFYAEITGHTLTISLKQTQLENAFIIITNDPWLILFHP